VCYHFHNATIYPLEDGLNMEPVKVIMRFANGRLIKGYTRDFYPNKPLSAFGRLTLIDGCGS